MNFYQQLSQHLEAGTPLWIWDVLGHRYHGRLKDVSEDCVSLEVSAGDYGSQDYDLHFVRMDQISSFTAASALPYAYREVLEGLLKGPDAEKQQVSSVAE